MRVGAVYERVRCKEVDTTGNCLHLAAEEIKYSEDSRLMSLFFRITWCFLSFLMIAGPGRAELRTLAEVQESAESAGLILAAPDFENTPEEISTSLEAALTKADRAGDVIAELASEDLTYENVILALDDLGHDLSTSIARIYLLKEVSPDAEIREVASEAVKRFQDWQVEFSYREDIYKAVQAYAETEPELHRIEQRLLEDTLRDYRRKGFHLPLAAREELQEMQKELARLSTDFGNNIREAKASVVVDEEGAAGFSEDLRNTLRTGDGEYSIAAHVTWQYIAAMQQARNEDTRKELLKARYGLAQASNVPLMQRIVDLRARIAERLGYANWADFKTEVKMAGSGQEVKSFLSELVTGLEPKWQEELAILREMKASDQGTAVEDTAFHLWDWRHYSERLRQEKYEVDAEALKVYFPYQETLEGMFDVYEELFGLKIEPIENPEKWHEDVTLHVIFDAQTELPLGLFYLDMFPREGKYNHFAQFGLIDAKQYSDGTERRPVAALICNFVPATEDRPSLLQLREVETLFHEFGHCLHTIMTRSPISRYAGTSVPRDFVEAPSQVLEYWVKDKAVLDQFAGDYRDREKKIPQEMLDRIEAAELATIGGFYRRQLVFGTLDLRFHMKAADRELDVLGVTEQCFEEILLPMPGEVAFIGYFGHLTGYDAGYYGYAWSDVIAADLADQFAKSDKGFMNPELGLKLRREIFEPGDTRDVSESVRAFLGREPSMDPFLAKLGIEKRPETAKTRK